MMSGHNNDWEHSKVLARAMLRDRRARRKVMGAMLCVVAGIMVAGVWIVDQWLSGNPWLFLAWWGVCAFLTCMLLLFAVYDSLAVIREEREKHR